VAVERTFFPNLDGLRFVACSLVLLQHAFYEVVETKTRDGAILPLLRDAVFLRGEIGVSLFFVLSGFLITYLLLKEKALTGSIDIRAFYIRRALRIWPLYFIVLICTFVIYPLVKRALGYPAIIVGNWVYHLLFLNNFDVLRKGMGRDPMSIDITWSVGIEEQFYLFWPLLLLWVPTRWYSALFGSVILTSVLFRVVQLEQPPVLYFHTLSVISDMGLGALAAHLSLSSERVRLFISGLSRRTIAITYGLGMLLSCFGDNILDVPAFRIFARLITGSFFVFIILEQNLSDRSLVKMSRFTIASKLGGYTYGLYLIHPIALLIFDRLGAVLGLGQDFVASLGVRMFGVVASVLLARLSYHLYEARFLRLKKRWSPLEGRGK
jgi:peptidoglycan/LPS O-acetylase OafA/YrhL